MIRNRLLLTVTVAVAVTVGAGSWLIVRSLEDRLIDNVDEQFRSGAIRQEVVDQLSSRPLPSLQTGGPFADRRQVAIVQYDSAGEHVAFIPAGFDHAPDPLPDAASVRPDDGLVTVRSTDGTMRYRASVLAARDDGSRIVAAASLAEVDATLDEARGIQLAVTGGAIVIVGVACWLLIRRAFTPIDDMVTTAGRIAAGDLTERTSVQNPDNEVGQLGSALNTMLDRIEEAVDEKTASEARMRRFVADASHDLRTPLTSIRGYAELYRQGADDPESVERGMARIEAESTRMSRLVDDLLMLARLDRQRQIDFQPVDLSVVTGEAVNAIRTVDDDRIYDLHPEPGVTVMGDADQLRQMIDNLLTNAHVHTPAGTTVSVALTQAEGVATLVVADDGPGFSDADRPRAFDRFWQSTRADQNRTQGSGLGLSIVASIVEAHSGTVSLEPSQSGGARFTITLSTYRSTDEETSDHGQHTPRDADPGVHSS